MYRELTKSKRDLDAAIDWRRSRGRLSPRPTTKSVYHELREILDEGEAEAIILAIERGADLMLVDERRGRRTATAAGLTVIGLLGVVVLAKRTGLIDLAKPVLDDLIQTARFWIGSDLYSEVLAELDEA